MNTVKLTNRAIFSKNPPGSFINLQAIWWFGKIFTVLLLFGLAVDATPIPAMGSAVLVSLNQGHMFNIKGFKLNRGSTNWVLEADSAKELSGSVNETTCCRSPQEISVRYLNPSSQGFLAVKTETLKAPTSLEIYTKKWLRDYSYYGFEILGAKGFSQANARGYVIDLYHAKQDKQMRQVVFLKEKTAVIFTCGDDKSQFSQTLGNCNNILKTFSWL